jgi:hypothetical protein
VGSAFAGRIPARPFATRLVAAPATAVSFTFTACTPTQLTAPWLIAAQAATVSSAFATCIPFRFVAARFIALPAATMIKALAACAHTQLTASRFDAYLMLSLFHCTPCAIRATVGVIADSQSSVVHIITFLFPRVLSTHIS